MRIGRDKVEREICEREMCEREMVIVLRKTVAENIVERENFFVGKVQRPYHERAWLRGWCGGCYFCVFGREKS
mgnify:CR=1 FL=1